MREVDLIGRIETPISLRARMNANAVTTTNYNELGNKPKINGVTLYGDLTPEELGIFYGAPFVANTVADMTNTDKVYVYTGSETGYVAGNWYYYDGSAWVSGGVYNSAAVQTDKTLTQEDKAADAKVVGDALTMKAGIIEDTVTGEIVSFVPDKTIDKLLDASLEMSPIQSLNGYDSPWPAGRGKNKLPPNAADTSITRNGVTVTAKNGVYTFSGVATASAYFSFTLTAEVDASPSTYKIAFLNTISIANMSCNILRADGVQTHYWGMSPANRVAEGWTDTGNERIGIIAFSISSGTSVNGLVVSPMLVRLSDTTPTTFSPYSNICPISGHTGAELNVAAEYDAEDATTYSVTFPETIYGGSHEFVSGKAVSNMVTIALGGVAFTKYSVAQGNLFRSPALPNCGLIYDSLNILCSAYPTKRSTARTDISISCGSNGRVDIIDNRYSDADSFNAAMSGVQLVYELATPLEYTLSPQQLTTLQGQNVVWGNGTATIKYAADAKTYIDNKIAAAVAALS